MPIQWSPLHCLTFVSLGELIDWVFEYIVLIVERCLRISVVRDTLHSNRRESICTTLLDTPREETEEEHFETRSNSSIEPSVVEDGRNSWWIWSHPDWTNSRMDVHQRRPLPNRARRNSTHPMQRWTCDNRSLRWPSSEWEFCRLWSCNYHLRRSLGSDRNQPLYRLNLCSREYFSPRDPRRETTTVSNQCSSTISLTRWTYFISERYFIPEAMPRNIRVNCSASNDLFPSLA